VGKEEFDRKEYVAIHEIYYDNQNNPNTSTMDAILEGTDGENSFSHLKWMLEKMLKALNDPILVHNKKTDKIELLKQEKQDEFSKSFETEK